MLLRNGIFVVVRKLLFFIVVVVCCLVPRIIGKKQGKPNWKYKCSDKTGHNHPLRKTFSFIIQGEPCKYCVYTLSSFLFSLSEIMILFFTSMSGNLHNEPMIMKNNFLSSPCLMQQTIIFYSKYCNFVMVFWRKER